MRMEVCMQHRPASFWICECQIEKLVELPAGEFSALLEAPMRRHPFIEENQDSIYEKDGVMHCLMALGQGHSGGVAVAYGDQGRAVFASYLPGARDAITRELDSAVEFIVRRGAERAEPVCFEELEERFGLTIRIGSGLDRMLREALESRPEVAEVELDAASNCVTAVCRHSFCPDMGM